MAKRKKTREEKDRDMWIAALIFGALVILGALFGGSSSSGGGSSGGGGGGSSCEQVWQQHESDARKYGYPAGDHESFVARCEQGHEDIKNAVENN